LSLLSTDRTRPLTACDESTERPNTVTTPKADLSRHSEGRAGTVCLVLDAEALSTYGLDPNIVESVTGIVE